MGDEISHSPSPKWPLQAKLCVLIIASASAYMVYGCFSMAASISASKDAERALIGTVSAADRMRLGAYVRDLQSAGVILKVVVDHQEMMAEVHVLRPYHALDVDSKSQLLRLVYLNAFGLPSHVKKFSGLMYVMDGVTGEQLQTIDMNMRGTQFKG